MNDACFTCYNDFSFTQETNLTVSEQQALKSLMQNKDIVIQKSDKGNSIDIIDCSIYKRSIENLLSNTTKFSKIDIPFEKDVNFTIAAERKLRECFGALQKKVFFSESFYQKLFPTGSKPGILYGLPILSAIDTPRYNLAKFLVLVLSHIASNEYTVKDSYAFVDEKKLQQSNNYMDGKL